MDIASVVVIFVLVAIFVGAAVSSPSEERLRDNEEKKQAEKAKKAARRDERYEELGKQLQSPPQSQYLKVLENLAEHCVTTLHNAFVSQTDIGTVSNRMWANGQLIDPKEVLFAESYLAGIFEVLFQMLCELDQIPNTQEQKLNAIRVLARNLMRDKPMFYTLSHGEFWTKKLPRNVWAN